MDQRTLFNGNVKHVQIYHSSPKIESKTEGAQVKLTATQKEALQSICKKQGIGLSTFIAEALDTYIEIYPYRSKIMKHREIILCLLDSMS